jgi:hypothetical protein
MDMWRSVWNVGPKRAVMRIAVATERAWMRGEVSDAYAILVM